MHLPRHRHGVVCNMFECHVCAPRQNALVCLCVAANCFLCVSAHLRVCCFTGSPKFLSQICSMSRTLYREGGLLAFFAGALERVSYFVPGGCIFFWIMETLQMTM